MNQSEKIQYENILKDIKVIANRNMHGEAPEIDAEIVRSATRIYLFEKYHEGENK